MPTYVTDGKPENTSEAENSVSEFPSKAPQNPQIGSSDSSETVRVRYEGYKFFKADPIPGQRPTWTKVERMEMHMSEIELCKKVQKRANKVSAAQQYQNLSQACQAHVNQLIHEKRQINNNGDWSCVYAKQREKPIKPRNARPNDYEVVSMQVILMQRPMQTTSYPRTPMGDLIDLEPHIEDLFQQDRYGSDEENNELVNRKLQSHQSQLRHRSLPPYRRTQKDHIWRSVKADEGDQPIPELPARPSTANLAQEFHESGPNKGTWRKDEDKREMQSNTNRKSPKLNKSTDLVQSEGRQDACTSVSHHAASNNSSTIGCPSKIACQCQGSPLLQPDFTHQRSLNTRNRESDADLSCQRSEIDLNMVRRRLSDGPLPLYPSDRIDAMHTTNILPAKRSSTVLSDNSDAIIWRKKMRIHHMDEEEVRSRLLDCEARIQQWEKNLHDQTRILQMTIQSSPVARFCQ